ncbi:MAG: glycerol-3-phosphate acyltransferase [Chloroflexota bacterium]|nr:MAG: glycerol-3-phosphate acyltransferase [Chloroflexota bacterium]
MVIDLAWVIFAFFCGSLPLSYWVGKLFVKADIRQIGDGNPGGANVWKAGGSWWGISAILLDGLKGLIPVSLAFYLGGVDGWWLFLVSIAPVIGHIFSPFLKFQGGKALATTFGVWTALTLYQVPLAFGISLGLWFWLLKNDGLAVIAGVLSVLVILLVGNFDLVLVSTWIANGVILVWRYSDKLGGIRQAE